jgi:transposase
MGKQDRFTAEFTRDGVAQVVDRGYPVCEVAERLGVRCPAGECEAIAEREHEVDLYMAAAVFAASEGDPRGGSQADEIRRLKRDLARVTDLSRTRKQSGRLFSRRMGTS